MRLLHMIETACSQVMCCFMVPRGVPVNVGAYVEESSNKLRLEAGLGSKTYGILSNRYLDDSYKTKRYWLDVTVRMKIR